MRLRRPFLLAVFAELAKEEEDADEDAPDAGEDELDTLVSGDSDEERLRATRCRVADRDMSASALLSSSRPSVHETFSYAETYPLARLPFASLQPHPSAARTFEEAQPPSAAELTGFQGSSTCKLCRSGRVVLLVNA